MYAVPVWIPHVNCCLKVHHMWNVYILWHESLCSTHVFQPFLLELKCFLQSPRAKWGHKTAVFPTVTHLQSVSLPSVCSHLISAHTLCLSLPSPRLWDAICMGHTHTQTHCMLYSASSHGFLTQHIRLHGGDRGARHQRCCLTFHQPQYTGSMCSVINTSDLCPKPCCGVCVCPSVCVCVCMCV